MTRVVLAIACAILFSGFLAGVARSTFAQSDGAASTDEVKARKLYEEAESNYAAGNYEDAAELFLEAYDLSGFAELLFNAANCYERMGEYKQAADYLRKYLDSGEAEDIVSVRQRIQRLDLAVQRQEAGEKIAEPADPDEDSPPVNRAPLTAPPPNPAGPTDTPRRARAGYWWLGGASLALASGVGFSIAASSAGDEAAQRCNAAGLCQQTAEKWVTRERRFAIAADVSYVTAAGAGIVGVYLLLRKPTRAEARETAGVHPIIVPGGIGIGLAGEL